MKVLYLHQYFNTPEMSGSTRSYEMARRLVAMGHEIHMITSWRENDDRKKWFITHEAGIKVHWLPVPYSNHMSYSDRMRAFFRFAYRAALKASSLPADVVFATSTPLTIALPGVYAATRQGIPMIFEVRDLWPEVPIALGALKNPLLKSMAWSLQSFAYKKSTAIVALSERMRQSIVDTGYPPECVTRIPNCADLDNFTRRHDLGTAFRKQIGVDEHKILISYTGTIGKVNGVDYIVRLANYLKHDDRFSFLIVGDGCEKEKVVNLAIELECLGFNLNMLPRVPKAEVPKILSATDIAMSTVMPMPILEADSANKVFDGLAAGCCIAVNHGGWLTSLLEESGAGIKLSFSPAVAAKQLQELVRDGSTLHEYGKAARNLAETEFSREKLASVLEQVLIAALQKSVTG